MSKWLYWLPSVLWMGVIFYSSSQPYQNQDIKPFLSENIDLSFLKPILGWIEFGYHDSVVSISSLGVNSFVEFFVRKGAHVTVFFLLMLFFFLALHKVIANGIRWTILLSLFLTILYAVFDEMHQGFTPGRTPYAGDVILDSFGGLLGVIIILDRHKRTKKREQL